MSQTIPRQMGNFKRAVWKDSEVGARQFCVRSSRQTRGASRRLHAEKWANRQVCGTKVGYCCRNTHFSARASGAMCRRLGGELGYKTDVRPSEVCFQYTILTDPCRSPWSCRSDGEGRKNCSIEGRGYFRDDPMDGRVERQGWRCNAGDAGAGRLVSDRLVSGLRICAASWTVSAGCGGSRAEFLRPVHRRPPAVCGSFKRKVSYISESGRAELHGEVSNRLSGSQSRAQLYPPSWCGCLSTSAGTFPSVQFRGGRGAASGRAFENHRCSSMVGPPRSCRASAGVWRGWNSQRRACPSFEAHAIRLPLGLKVRVDGSASRPRTSANRVSVWRSQTRMFKSAEPEATIGLVGCQARALMGPLWARISR